MFSSKLILDLFSVSVNGKEHRWSPPRSTSALEKGSAEIAARRNSLVEALANETRIKLRNFYPIRRFRHHGL
jgi:hypothetical protein